MLSKAKIKYIKSLHVKKHRIAEQRFIAEGTKSVCEFIDSKFTTDVVYGTDLFWKQHKKIVSAKNIPFELASEFELIQAGTLKSNNGAIAVIKLPNYETVKLEEGSWIIMLDGINDPGNLGAIIRIADWYGINRVIISENSVDMYNPKVVNTTKGSLARVRVEYGNLPRLLTSFNGVIIGAEMKGEDIHTFNSTVGGVLIMGSESHGISTELRKFIATHVTIPRIGGAESLNVAVATAIICDNIVRLNN
ncbi:MAG: RNA methyltransferase [Cyclobacteriaceae bacterium]|nr:RNA methyltransferase [Cyclobacteriaceae bacterium]